MEIPSDQELPEHDWLPPIDPDGLELHIKRQRALAKLFGEREEPARLGHHRLLGEIGRGGFGVVYAAHDTKLDRKVAIKRMSAPDRERFRREAMAMAKLSHPNVIPVYEIVECEDAVFIVMEFVEGLTLREWLVRPRTRAEVLAVFEGAARGLIAAHDKQLVHRDFKPSNVMVGEDGRARVMDFGLARANWDSSELEPDAETLGRSEAERKAAFDSITRSGAVLGTPAYMSPEQYLGLPAKAVSDQFSFCVALYEALYGRRPFSGATIGKLRAAVIRGQLEEPAADADVPAWLRAIVCRGLAVRPEERFASLQDLLDALIEGQRAETGDVPITQRIHRRLEFGEAREAFRQSRLSTIEVEPEFDPRVVFVASKVSRRYRRHGFCLEGVDLRLRSGAIVGLVGPNGSGKTTLLRIIAGELSVDQGEVCYPSLGSRGRWRTIKQQIAYVPQDSPRWYGPLQHTLRFEAALHGLRGADNDEEVEFVLHRLGLSAYADMTWSQISGGYKTRFELARALMKRPRLIILDEPLAPLDVVTQQLYLRDLRAICEIQDDPPAIILSSQHLHEIESVADELIMLDEGQVLFCGALAKLRDERKNNVFELGFRGDDEAVKRTLCEGLGPKIRLERVGMIHVLTTARGVGLARVVGALGEAELELDYIRDISGSTRRLFEVRGG